METVGRFDYENQVVVIWPAFYNVVVKKNNIMAYSMLSKKLLAVEDDLHMQRVLKKFLGFAFDVAVSADGEIALAVAQAGNISDRNITGSNRAGRKR